MNISVKMLWWGVVMCLFGTVIMEYGNSVSKNVAHLNGGFAVFIIGLILMCIAFVIGCWERDDNE